MKRFYRLIISITLVISLLPLASLNAQTGGSDGKRSSALTFAGLERNVTIRRDGRGVPYIEAETENDLYFAQGYVTASDRLWQMDLLRRTARGELSEIFGKSTLEEDKRRRIYGFARISEITATKASPRVRASLEAYARGVNAYISSLDDASLPLEFRMLQYRPRPWTPADSIVIGKSFAEVLSTTWMHDLMRAAFAKLPPEKYKAIFPSSSPLDVPVVGTDDEREAKPSAKPKRSSVDWNIDARDMRELAEIEASMRRTYERVGLYAEDLAASNNWVVSGAHTASGKPMLANDPHLPPSAPSIWYLTHLSMPGLRVAGVTSPGAPGILIGHNQHIAWGATNLGPDVQDLFLEHFDPENPRRYRTPDGWREAEVRREEIRVRTSPGKPDTEIVNFNVTVTRNGPVVFERDGRRFALRWTSLDENAVDFEGFFYMNHARNWKEFTAALKNYRGPTQNFIYADTAGHIGYYGAGNIPLRKTGDGSLPYDGARDADVWTGFIPFEELPHVYDPPSGIIVTANSRVAGRSYPHHLTNLWAAPTRTRRIYDLLKSKKKKLTVEDFRAIQADAHSISAATFTREVSEVAREAELEKKDERWKQTLQLFRDWDGGLHPDSRAALLAHEMRTMFGRKILTAALGRELASQYRWGSSAVFFDALIEERPHEWLPEGVESYAELLNAVHKEAREALTKRLGADESKWTWGAENVVRFSHPLADTPEAGRPFQIAPFPQTGGGGSAFASPNVGSGVSMRFIADLSDWNKTLMGIALGQSGDPRSPHWSDQLADWRGSAPRVFPFTQRAVETAATVALKLSPAKARATSAK